MAFRAGARGCGIGRDFPEETGFPGDFPTRQVIMCGLERESPVGKVTKPGSPPPADISSFGERRRRR
jgi:hypothetical protein